jgi:hypothetical protein
MRWILGDESYGNVQAVSFDGTTVTDADLVYLTAFKRLIHLSLSLTEVTDTGLMRHVANIRSLKGLSLYGTPVTDAGVEKLRKALPNCQIGYPMKSPSATCCHPPPASLAAFSLTGKEGAIGLNW